MADRHPVTSIAVRADRSAGYEIRIAPGAFRAGRAEIATPPGRALLVATPTVARLYGVPVCDALRRAGWALDILVLPLTESGKTIEAALEICREARALGLGRDDSLIGLGGGVCTDLVTMAASLLRRGIPHIRIPTTLMGQVDAAIGIKGAVNFAGKNSLGCFHPPRTVIVDPDFLRTLPWREVRSGLAEIVKIATVRDAALFADLEADWSAFRPGPNEGAPAGVVDIVARAVAVMIEELSPNLWEDRSRARLCDFGHSFSPAIEAGSSYRRRHGEAVAIDMAISTLVGKRLGVVRADTAGRLLALLHDIGLPVSDPCATPDLCTAALDEAARHRAGAANLAVPAEIGSGAFVHRREDIRREDLAAVLAELAPRESASADRELHVA